MISAPASMVISPPYEGCPILTTCSSHESRDACVLTYTRGEVVRLAFEFM